MQNKTLLLITQARNILAEYNPMTLRQIYYQLVATHIIENKRSEYQKLSNALVTARQENIIPWEWIEDRVRRPQVVSMWQDLPDFIETVKGAYRKDIWDLQPHYIEVWLEKDARSGIFSDITNAYGITLMTCRGYNSWSAYKEAAARFKHYDKPVKLLYFGDFDPSGEDMVRAIEDSLNYFETCPEIKKIALTEDDIKEYDLPPDFTKKTDSRAAAFIKAHGDIAVELDALPLPVLQDKIRQSIAGSIDIVKLITVQEEEKQDQQELSALLR